MLSFLAVGILGFVPGITNNEMLLGTFMVNGAHNVVHIASGIIFLLAAMGGTGPSRMWFQIFGIIYAVVAIWGFAVGTGNTLFIVSNNPPISWLHVVLAVVILLIGFGSPRQAVA